MHEGIGNRSTVSSPHTPQPLRTHFPSGFSATVSTAVYAGGFVGRPTTDIALWAYLRLACVARSVTYTVCSFACSLQNSNLPHTASSVFIGCAWSVFPLHSRLMLGLPFALAKVILLACLALSLDSALQSRPARSHPCGARTRVFNIPRRTSKKCGVHLSLWFACRIL